MDNSNLTMEEYIRLGEEKAPIIVNNDFAPQDTLQCKSQVSTPVNDGIDFRISFGESDDEDYTIIYDKNSFSYKMISVNNLKTDSENDYEKVMPLIPSPKPMISCFDDLDFFKYFENEFPAIVYNDAQTSKLDFLTEPTVIPQHIDEFDLKSINTTYPEEWIWRIDFLYSFRRGKVYNWETATYGKIWDNEDVHDLGSVETEFPDIVFNDMLTSKAALSCVPTVSSLNYEIDFRILFDESDDEDCTSNTEYSLNETALYMYQYGVSWGIDTTYQLPIQTFGKLSTKLVKVSTSLKCWSLETSRRLFNTRSCSIKLHGESTYEQNIREFLI
ncbi:hypothetical protein Tco_0482091 [Tanacetum coccineum]